MTADFYIKKLEQGYLVTQLSQNYNIDPKKEWAFATLTDLLKFIREYFSK